jgi:hypothetical protein
VKEMTWNIISFILLSIGTIANTANLSKAVTIFDKIKYLIFASGDLILAIIIAIQIY